MVERVARDDAAVDRAAQRLDHLLDRQRMGLNFSGPERFAKMLHLIGAVFVDKRIDDDAPLHPVAGRKVAERTGTDLEIGAVRYMRDEGGPQVLLPKEPLVVGRLPQPPRRAFALPVGMNAREIPPHAASRAQHLIGLRRAMIEPADQAGPAAADDTLEQGRDHGTSGCDGGAGVAGAATGAAPTATGCRGPAKRRRRNASSGF